MTRLLSERLTTLLSEVDTIEAESVKPLDECQSLIEHGVSQADELLREGGYQKGQEYHQTFTVSLYQIIILILDPTSKLHNGVFFTLKKKYIQPHSLHEQILLFDDCLWQ